MRAEKEIRHVLAICRMIDVQVPTHAWRTAYTQLRLAELCDRTERSAEAEGYYLAAVALGDSLVSDFPNVSRALVRPISPCAVLGDVVWRPKGDLRKRNRCFVKPGRVCSFA